MITADKNVLIAECDLRYPVTFSEETVYDLLTKKLEGSDIGIVKDFTKKPIYVDPESDFAKGLLSAYSEETGDVDSKPIALGGGTFARAFPSAVAFCPVIDESMEIMHEANEYIAVDDLMLLTQIYRRAIINLDAIK
jgi:succinyl-diaminopimelate desuccinylase